MSNNNPWKSGSKFLLLFVVIFLILGSLGCLFTCKPKEYKYKIEGYVKNPTEWDKYKGYYSAVAYTDTFECTKDSLWYFNSNKTKVTLYKYKIYQLKY